MSVCVRGMLLVCGPVVTHLDTPRPGTDLDHAGARAGFPSTWRSPTTWRPDGGPQLKLHHRGGSAAAFGSLHSCCSLPPSSCRGCPCSAVGSSRGSPLGGRGEARTLPTHTQPQCRSVRGTSLRPAARRAQFESDAVLTEISMRCPSWCRSTCGPFRDHRHAGCCPRPQGSSRHLQAQT